MKLFTPKIRSRHGSHDIIRGKIKPFPLRSVVRFGSTTPTTNVFPLTKDKVIELNTVQAVKTSASKLLMKQAFHKAGIKTADWWIGMTLVATKQVCFHLHGNDYDNKQADIKELPYSIVAKFIYGSRGTGNYLLKSPEELEGWLKGKDLSKYIFERFYAYSREYRLHCTKDGCFYTCRKMLKDDVPKEKRWFRNDSNSVWILEENPMFDKPKNWEEIVQECVKALKAVGLDMGAFDVRVQSAKDKDGNTRKQVDFIVLESNSAPSFGEVTAEKYKEVIPKLINDKIENGH